VLIFHIYFLILFSNGFDHITVVKCLFHFLALTDLSPPMTFALTDCHKLKSHGLPTYCHLFSYIKKRDERQREKKKERRETEEIKIEIRPFQF
jgi:hypothetical protein